MRDSIGSNDNGIKTNIGTINGSDCKGSRCVDGCCCPEIIMRSGSFRTISG